MARYFKPRADWWNDDAPLIPDVSVNEHVPKDTGLVWASGEKIMRSPNPIGFGRDKEW